jgi:hypothetical protein
MICGFRKRKEQSEKIFWLALMLERRVFLGLSEPSRLAIQKKSLALASGQKLSGLSETTGSDFFYLYFSRSGMKIV